MRESGNVLSAIGYRLRERCSTASLVPGTIRAPALVLQDGMISRLTGLAGSVCLVTRGKYRDRKCKKRKEIKQAKVATVDGISGKSEGSR